MRKCPAPRIPLTPLISLTALTGGNDWHQTAVLTIMARRTCSPLVRAIRHY